MRITIQVTCDDVEDAQRVMKKLAAPDNTWVDQVDKLVATGVHTNPRTMSSARLDKIMGDKPIDDAAERKLNMGSSGEAAEQSGSNDGATGAPRPNNTPGAPAIGKIGGATKILIFEILASGKQPDMKKYSEHCKLLWERGEIKFDDRAGMMEYYL